uniref:Uncharacterized protein n=2 Tax=Cuerna arida TaxID=1464854 RepID=A0A1B6FSG5_9HEMI
MQKGDPHLMWTVCLQNRCAESLWTIDFGYRIVPNNHQVNEFLERKRMPHPHWAMVGGRVADEVVEVNTTRVRPVWFTSGAKGLSPRRTHSSGDGEALERTSDNDNNYDDLTITTSPVDFWKRFTERDYESQDPSSGVSLLLTLIFYLVLFVYFFICATVICSYSAQLYDEYRMYNDNSEDEDERVKDEEDVQTQTRRESLQ